MNDTSSTERQNSASTPRNTYILIDFENVQPTHLGRLNDPSVLVKIFLGPSQSKIPVSLAVSLQPLGTNVEYIVLTSFGKNALDFLIRMKASKPRTTKTLLSTIQSLFNKALSEEEASDLLKQLCAKGKAKIDGTKVSYSL